MQWYEILDVLGQGGFGITYLANDTNLAQQVAIKEFLPVDLAYRNGDSTVRPLSQTGADDYARGLQRFIAEARTLARFDHPNIVRVLAVFEANGTAYMVMRFEHGQPLSTMLSTPGPGEERLRAIALQLVAGLEQVHAAGFIHRDIKPANIYIRADGSPVLLDFGSARAALGGQSGAVTSMVSPGYAPYEQYLSDSAAQGPWTDIYALGATLYHAAFATAPLSAIDRSKPIIQGEGDPLVPASRLGEGRYSPRFLAAIDGALEFLEADRPQSLAAWRLQLDSGQATASGSAASRTARGNDARTVRVDPATTIAAAPAPVGRREAGRGLPQRIFANRRLLAATAIGLLCAVATLVALLVSAPEDATSARYETPAQSGQSAADERTSRIRSLLDGASEDLRALRLTTPPGENAYDKYLDVLAIDPSNPDATAGIRKISARYIDLARGALVERDWRRARRMLDNARFVDPENADIELLVRELQYATQKRGRGRDKRH